MTRKEYNECVPLWADALFRFACKQTNQSEDAQDVVQQAFEVLWKERENVSMEKAKSFLFVVAYRKCMDVHRNRKKVFESHQLLDFPIQTEDVHQSFARKEWLDKALMQLDEQSRALILLKDLEGYKYEEIASMCDLSLEQVKVYLHRARKKLKELISPLAIANK